MKEHKLFVIASLLLSCAWATTLEDALASDYADCYDPSGTCSCTHASDAPTSSTICGMRDCGKLR